MTKQTLDFDVNAEDVINTIVSYAPDYGDYEQLIIDVADRLARKFGDQASAQTSQLEQMEAQGCCVCAHHEFTEKAGLPENPYGTTYVCSACGTLHMFGYGKEVPETEIVYLNPAVKDRCLGKPVWKCE